MTGDDLAVLDGADITDEQMHDACIVVLGHAIGVVGADVETLRDMLRPDILPAIGALPYEPWPRGPWGDPYKEGRPQ